MVALSKSAKYECPEDKETKGDLGLWICMSIRIVQESDL
jgi:hypothetical protein